MIEQQRLFGAGAERPTRALTLWQPWAWLCAHGHKTIENRPPGFSHKNFRGWFWIHAGRKARLTEWMLCQEMCRQNGFTALPAFSDVQAYPLGAIVGKARVTGIIGPTATLSESWHLNGQYGLVLESAVALERPVECRGFQSFWHVPTEVLAELEEQTK